MPERSSFLKKIDICTPALAFFLFLLVILRIPNFFEPYWYGDEGIYLTIGNAIRNGSKLYTDIVDHKTPLIYFFAAVGNQFNFRVLLLSWMIVTTVAFYYFCSHVYTNKWSRNVALLFFVLLTTLPWFEGNIPNGELFVMGFVIVGWWILTRTTYFQNFLSKHTHRLRHQTLFLFAAGCCFGLAVLTKVPAILDFAAVVTIGWFTLTTNLLQREITTLRSFWRHFLRMVVQMVLLGLGFITPVLLSILYFWLIGSGQDYLNFGLLYNLHYTNNWTLTFTSPILQFFYTMPGKLSIVLVVMTLLTLGRKYVSPLVQFASAWFIFALFASLLSNRPYPHYFLQVIPPAALLLGTLFEKEKKTFIPTLISVIVHFSLAIGVLLTLHVGLYQTAQYYQRFFNLMTNKQNPVEYRNQFNYALADNYAVAPIIMGNPDRYLFIWGTNPMLYAMTKKQPTGRFTVSFHIIDLKVYDETFNDLVEKHPEFVVVMKDEQTQLPGLQAYLRQNYIPNFSYQNFILWRKRSVSTL